MQITMPNMPETLTYAVLASLGIDLITALLLAVRSDWLGVGLMLAVADMSTATMPPTRNSAGVAPCCNSRNTNPSATVATMNSRP